jgi:DNA-binding NtrC family response regulator
MKAPTVLLILEELRDLEVSGTWLRSMGYKILMCSSLAQGMNSLETESVSLVIVSQGTSAFEGRKVLKRALQFHSKVSVLVVARVLDMRCYLEAMDLGAIDYLERPEPQGIAWVVETEVRRAASA